MPGEHAGHLAGDGARVNAQCIVQRLGGRLFLGLGFGGRSGGLLGVLLLRGLFGGRLGGFIRRSLVAAGRVLGPGARSPRRPPRF